MQRPYIRKMIGVANKIATLEKGLTAGRNYFLEISRYQVYVHDLDGNYITEYRIDGFDNLIECDLHSK